MEHSERSLLLDAIVLYEKLKSEGGLLDAEVENWERWKRLALGVLYPNGTTQ
jgi:hypothetical protein